MVYPRVIRLHRFSFELGTVFAFDMDEAIALAGEHRLRDETLLRQLADDARAAIERARSGPS
jgi:hypothetical protein